jgi:hypothetical protein
MRNRNSNFDVVEKFKVIRSIYDKFFISIAGSLWIFSTLWDIYKLQRYWLDYTIEFYSCFFIFYMMMYSINPRALPTKIYNSFRLITTIRGRGALLIIISSLFLDDKHAFHKSCAILLFIGGILYFICEILVPTTKDELDQIESIYNNSKKDTTSSRNENVSNTYNSTNPMNSSTIQNQDKSTEILENNPSNIIPNDNEGKANKNQNESEEQNIKTMNNNGNENKEYNGPNTKVEEEIVKKTDNPYEIPEDF